MAASKSYRFHGSQIRVLTGFVAESPAQAITSITATNPPVVGSTAHGLVDGAVVKLSGIVGPDELNDELFVVIDALPNTFALADVDASEYDAYVSGGIIETAELSNFCELTSYNRAPGQKPEDDTTSLCSTAKDYELGLRDFGTTSIEYLFAPRTAIQTALQEFDRTGDPIAVKIILPNAGGEMIQIGFVQSMGESASVGTSWRGSLTIRNTGSRIDIAA